MSRDAYETLEDCTVIALTAAAVLVTYDGSNHWIPLSVIAEPDDLERLPERLRRWLDVVRERVER